MKTKLARLALLSAVTSLTCLRLANADVVDVTGKVPPAGGVWLETIDLSQAPTGFGRPSVAATVAGNPLSIAGKAFAHGVGTHADAAFVLNLGGGATRFIAEVGVDDDLKCFESQGATKAPRVEFSVWVDGKKAATSGAMGYGQPPVRFDVDLRRARTLRLVVKKSPGSHYNHASWAGATLFMRPGAPVPTTMLAGNQRKSFAPLATKGAALSPSDEAKLHASQNGAGVWLDDLDLTKARVDAGNLWLGGIVSRAPRNPKVMTARRTDDGRPIRLAGVDYARGVASQGENELRIELGGVAERFVARVGFNTSFSCAKVSSGGDALFEVWVDGRPVSQTPHLHSYSSPYDISIDLRGAKLLVLNVASEGGPVVWAGAFLELAEGGKAHLLRTVGPPPPLPAIIAKRDPHELRINGARAVGATPRRAFVYRIPATGKPPLHFSAQNLPPGLSLDSHTGIITGTVQQTGSSRVEVKVTAANVAAVRTFTIVAGKDKLALTPPMGWNSWNVWGLAVDDAKVRAAADAMVLSGLAAQGYQYVNIDEGWSDGRDDDGNIKANAKFPDMPALSAYVHAKGLRLGIHNSPGPKTCGGGEGSYKHELQDARTWASWGIDYLKHDWCSYGQIAKDNSLKELQKPYKIMHAALASTGRDVVFSLCQYGIGDVWKWGRDVGGNLWRTGADILDTWASFSDVGFTQAGREAKIGPGGWNDPDMMIVGKLGWGSGLRPTRLTPDEQVAHVTLWSMLASPLLLGNDLTQLDEFTANLISNPEVIEINQDLLGRQAVRVGKEGAIEVWSRPLYDGTTAVAVFNRGQVAAAGTVKLKDLGITGRQRVRNLWLRQEQGFQQDEFNITVPSHGAVLLRIGKQSP